MSVIRTLSASESNEQRDREKAKLEKEYKRSDQKLDELVSLHDRDLTQVMQVGIWCTCESIFFLWINETSYSRQGSFIAVNDDFLPSSFYITLHEYIFIAHLFAYLLTD